LQDIDRSVSIGQGGGSRLSKAINIDDLRLKARSRLPKIFFDYIDGGAFSETTAARNRRDFSGYELMQRVLKVAEMPDLSTTYLGSTKPLPIMLGPVGFLGLYRGHGEIQTARAAKVKNVPMCLSTFSIGSIGRLRTAVGGDLQFQLYMDRDKSFVEKLLQSAIDAEIDVLYLTVDTSITSVREKDVRNGFRAVTRLTAPLLLSMMQRPAWCIDMLRAGTPSVEAVDAYSEFGKGALEQASKLSARLDSSLTWSDVAWLRDNWKGRLVVKGILSLEDAIIAKEKGADAIVISNHGGRQLDYAISTINALPAIRTAVGPDYDVLIDGGFRRGTDIAIALALGASGVLLGRAYAFGLAAFGQTGVERVIAILENELRITLKLMGVASVEELRTHGHDYVRERQPGLSSLA
jgi:isopentenyl diphosphate isomerase/L-lactate dehydrogenase-like FMN-dependent dehydrogenase